MEVEGLGTVLLSLTSLCVPASYPQWPSGPRIPPQVPATDACAVLRAQYSLLVGTFVDENKV